MTISVDGTADAFISQKNVVATQVFAANNQQARNGRVAIGILNQSDRFPERRMERLLIEQHAVNIFSGVISGIVKELGVNAARVIRVYRRSDGQFAGETVSSFVTGAYSLPKLDPDEEYFVLAFDDAGSLPDFNALVWDRVIP